MWSWCRQAVFSWRHTVRQGRGNTIHLLLCDIQTVGWIDAIMISLKSPGSSSRLWFIVLLPLGPREGKVADLLWRHSELESTLTTHDNTPNAPHFRLIGVDMIWRLFNTFFFNPVLQLFNTFVKQVTLQLHNDTCLIIFHVFVMHFKMYILNHDAVI